MDIDVLDALCYAYEFETRYLGKWVFKTKEENNMNTLGKLREDLKRIYGAADPLNYIEDVVIKETPCDTQIDVTLRVPSSCLRYAEYVSANMASSARCLSSAARVWEREFGVIPPDLVSQGEQKAPTPKHPNCKCSEKKLYPLDALKPERIIYSGPKTIVFWPDGTKTIVSRMEGQEHDDYTAFCAAVVKKMFGATHKAKKFLESVAVRPEPKQKKVKEAQMTMEELEVQFVGEDTARTVHVKPWETMETMPMPGTEDPNWGHKARGCEEL